MSLTRGNKKLSSLTSRMIPEHIRESKPNFEVFMKGFYRYLEQEGNPYDIITHIFEYGDIDETADEYVKYFKSTYMPTIPETFTTDFRLLLKKIKSFYRSKGSEQSFEFLVRFLFNSETTFYYPKVDMLRTSAGIWRTPTYIRPKGSPLNTTLTFYVDTKVQGESSGATAWIEKLESYLGAVHFRLVESTIEGTFADGEQLNIIDANKDFTSYTFVDIDDLSPPGVVQAVGQWEDETGFLSDRNKLQDSLYYQDFSYVIISEVSLKFYKEILKDLLHPAGYELFGELLITTGEAIDTDVLSGCLTENVLIQESTVTMALSLSDVLRLATSLKEVQVWIRSWNYYETQLDDPLLELFFNPCVIDDIPQSVFEDTPNERFPYYKSEIDILTDKVLAGTIDGTHSTGFRLAGSGPGSQLDGTPNGSRIIVSTLTGQSSVQIYTVSSDAVMSLEQTINPNHVLTSNEILSVAINAAGNVIVIGDPNDRSVSGPDFGSAEIWVRADTTWSYHSTLIGSGSTHTSDTFGFGHAIEIDNSGDYITVIDRSEQRIYVFFRSASTWSLQQYLAPASSYLNDTYAYMAKQTADKIILVAFTIANGWSIHEWSRSGVVWTESVILSLGILSESAISGDGLRYATGTDLLNVYFWDGSAWNIELSNLPSNLDTLRTFKFNTAGDALIAGDGTQNANFGGIEYFARDGINWTSKWTETPLTQDTAGSFVYLTDVSRLFSVSTSTDSDGWTDNGTLLAYDVDIRAQVDCPTDPKFLLNESGDFLLLNTTNDILIL